MYNITQYPTLESVIHLIKSDPFLSTKRIDVEKMNSSTNFRFPEYIKTLVNVYEFTELECANLFGPLWRTKPVIDFRMGYVNLHKKFYMNLTVGEMKDLVDPING